MEQKSKFNFTTLTSNQSGFTLLETLIALAIMVVAFSAILMTESGSLNITEKAKNINTITMLAKNKLIETELLIEGKSFSEIKDEEIGEFPEPYLDFTWSRKIKEIEFPNLNISPSASTEGEESESSNSDSSTDTMTKLLTSFLSKAIREVTVSVIMKKGKGTQEFSVSMYWVDLNHEFSLSQ